MTDPSRGTWRLARGGLLTSCCAALAYVGHLIGGGAPPLTEWFVLTVLLGAGFVLLADRQRRFGHIACAAVGSQVVFHVGFSFAEHQHGAGASPGPALSGPGSTTSMVPEERMLLGHLVAALVVGWLLAHGETVLWHLYALLRHAGVPTLDLPTPRAPAPVAPSHQADQTVRYEVSLRRTHPRRGPPYVLAT